MPTFSIIVPVYNAEKTLNQCLESLRAQTYRDFEVHLVENGSTDTSRNICEEFVRKDQRFQLHLYEKNSGPSGARNIGLDHARGTYIAFLDSDDYVESEYLQVLYRAFENADVVFFGYHQRLADGQFMQDHIPKVQQRSGYYEVLLQLLKQDMFGYTWIKAFCRELIGNHRFSQELNLLEDEVFACEVLAEPCRVAVEAKAIHNYITGNPGSLIGRTHPDYCRKVDAAYQAWSMLLEPYENKAEALEQMSNAHVSRCMYYGFERDVDPESFFSDLAATSFFANATAESTFISCVRAGNWGRISRMRRIYRLKNKIARLLKR